MEYNIVLESFEGPMDLLMHLIDKAKIDIYDININEITEQYIEYITKMDELDLEVTSEFLVMAATLLEIKSKMLLPQKKQENANNQLEIEEADPRLELVRRLIEYRKYKYISQELKEFEEIQKKVYFKLQEDLSYYAGDDEVLGEMDLDKLVKALNNLMLKNKKNKTFINVSEVQREEYTLEECMKKIEDKLEDKGMIKFSSLFDDSSSRAEIVVIFLSLLELIKVKSIIVRQKDNFSDILIAKQARRDD